MRGALATLFFSLALALVAGWQVARADAAASSAGPQTVTQQLQNGLTMVARKAGAAPVIALEVWIRCPSNDYDSSRPGIARLAAMALLDERSATSLSLRDATHIAGGQISVSVYYESTEIAILAPSYAAPALLDKLGATVARAYIDQTAFDSARTRLAAAQAAASEMPDQQLRDTLFAQMFASGPLHDSTYGDPKSLRDMTLQDVTKFLGRAYVPASEIAVAVGDQAPSEVVPHMSAFSASGVPSQPMPNSVVAKFAGAPFAIHSEQAAVGGVALGWVGPPISDERAATAMDFLSDYLTHPGDGTLVTTVAAVDSEADFSGQFITLRNPGVFFLTVAGTQFDPATLPGVLRDAVQSALGHEFSKADFAQARDAYATHLLRDMQTDEGLADNYGWYFAQGALPYSPSATDLALSGDYFSRVSSLTPDYVYSIAKKYLLVNPTIVVLPRSTPSPPGTPQ